MVLYALALIPLAEELRAAVPTVMQPWYADDMAMAGRVDGIAACMTLLLKRDPDRGYYPEPAKSVLVVPAAEQTRAKAALEAFDFTYTSGSRYLGGYIGDGQELQEWLQPKVAA